MSSAPKQEPTPPHQIKLEDEFDRGRVRNRSETKDADGFENDDAMDGDADGHHANSSNSDGGPARKRRRSRKGLDKKFECPEKGCGKSYSRAEHLYRHQLNHNPKQVYRCDWGDCTRTFVRLDLCNRHKDRHTAKGSALNRKDAMMGQGSPIVDGRHQFPPAGSTSPEVNRPNTAYGKLGHIGMPYHSPKDAMGSPYTPMTNTPPTSYPNGNHSNGVDYMHHDGNYMTGPGQRVPHHSPPGPQRPSVQTNVGPYGLSPVSTQPGYLSQQHNTPQSAAAVPQYVASQNFTPFTLPPSEFSTTSAPREPQQAYAPPTSSEYPEHNHQQQSSDMMLLDQMSMPTTIPVFGPADSILNKSPYVGMPEDFMAYLFNTNSGQAGEGSPMAGAPMQGYNYSEFNQYGVPYYGAESLQGYFPPSVAPQQVMSVTNLLDQNLPESIISSDKSDEIFEFIRERFHENGHAPIERQRDQILEGDRNDDSHMLSRRMMQMYIGSYWFHFSDQIPILHKPTFQPDKTPNLLLIAMMTIGAACLDKTNGQKMTKTGPKLSNFLAWHLRWEMFQDPNCRPPAKLWVFQTLLLLELYEKMYSTRELHERAHIHHATTITLMRRGRALIGKSALDSPPNSRDPEKQNGSRHSSTSGAAHTPDEWWNHWITNESTRRAAFAAFVIDSIHATMFGHSTVMVAHEMRLPLPCDEKLWKASSGAEVGRIEAHIMSGGTKPISFLEGLKRTLSNQEVQTNSFGRTILMAGLLSVSWHMNQRDLQVNSLSGVNLGGRDKWRGTLTRAFDSWKSDFDKSLSLSDPYYSDDARRNEANVVFESRTVLHHLAHMAMHVDIVDCQIFARAKRLLGRAIGQQDLSSAQRRMKDIWAPSAKARDATCYALKFLASVLCPEDSPPPPHHHQHHHNRAASSQIGGGGGGGGQPYARPPSPPQPYSARDDVLLNRPWVLYFAALVVWCYGYALEGACQPGTAPPPPTTQREKTRQMRQYLLKYSQVSSPEELKLMKGINQNTALMMILKDTFEQTQWELLQEGATLIQNCINLNSGAIG